VDEPALNENKISVLSDIHVYSQSLGTEGAAFEEYIANDRKMIAESELIFGAAIETIKGNDSGIVLVAGDLTKDGERVNHELVASKLKELENLGKRVFVINGNHDISNAKSLRYEDDEAIRIPTVSTDDFREIYNDFGYSEAIAKHEDTLSYVVELTPEYRMIVIDTCLYNNDIANPSSQTGGEIKPETLEWIKEQIKAAQKDGKKVIGMMHHGIVPHTDVQPTFFPEYLIADYAQRAEELADAGLLTVFTGHFHSQDIAARASQRGNKIYDIETGSTVTYPVPIRDVEINGDTLTVTSQKVDKVPGVDLGGKDFETYASEFLMVGLEQQVPGMLAGVLMGQGVPQEQAVLQAQAIAKTTITGTPYTVGQFLAGCMFKHYVGDEQQDAVTQAIINGFMTNADPMYKLLGSVASQLATDTDAGTENQVADNDAVITFKAVVPEEPDQTITITYTNDMHGRVFPDANNKGMIGIDKIAAISKNTKNSILVDIGDTIHGLPIANTTQGKNVVELLSLAGYELMVPGNHDFNYGSAKLKEYAQDTTKGFDIISANIVNKADQTPYLPGTAIREINGVKIGFFGLTTQTTPIVTNPVNVETLEFKAYLPASQAAIKKLKEDGAELIVGLAHVSRADIRALAGSLKEDVAVIIDAHDHISTNEMVEGVLIASAGQYEENIGQIILSLDGDKKVLTKTAKLITKAETETITGDVAVKARATQMMEAVNALFNEKIGVSEVLLDSSRGSATTKGVRNAEMPLGNLVADAMRTILHTDTALTNGGGLRANIGIGDVTKGHLNAVLPFGNYGVVKEVTPKALKQILENGVKTAPEPLGGFPQVSGMKFEYNPNAAAGSKVTKITINDKVLNLNDDTTKYTLATNDFMANGGDGYEAIKALETVSNGDSLDVIFENYVKEILKGRITAQSTQLEGRILAKVPSSGGGGGGGGSSHTNPPAAPVAVPETIQAKAEVTKAMADSLIAKAAADGNVEKGTPVEIKIESPAGAAKVTAEFTKDVFNQIAAGIKTDIVIKTEIASITLSPEVMNSISSQAQGNITINAEKVEKSELPQTAGDRPVYEFTIKNGEQTIASFGDSAVKVSIPYTLKTGEKSQSVVIYYLNGANQITPVTSSYNIGTETVDFITDHFSKYMVGYNAVSFSDIQTHWAKDVIEFVVSREIFGGTGSDTFGPNEKMTRGMLVTVLGRLAKAETAGIASSFTDVKKEAYYAPYVAWAVEKGIMSGVGANKFDPNRPVTREELTVILTNYIAFSGHELTPSAVKPEAFGDSSHVSTWAQKSVTQAQNAGLISSKANNMFDPKGQSTRAEVAALIQRTIQISLK
jgi:2',3'-cyclic-nucleotide 2'-phosphodiesterase (5'-nucleotidase family)/3',5'-cyclic AMP phosphodiesterase CpdA